MSEFDHQNNGARKEAHPRMSRLASRTNNTKMKLTTKGLIALIFVIGALIVGLYVFWTRPTAIDRLSLTYLDSLKKDSLGYEIPTSYEDPYEIEDYTVYGESLVLYHEDYEKTIERIDPLYGRNVMLKNIETGQELTYTFSGGADTGIPLGQLEPGVYEIYVYDGYTKKRAYSEEPFSAEPLITMRRNKEINYVNLDANNRYLRKQGVNSDKNYLYVTVTSSLPKVKVVDVMIDPSGLILYPNSTRYDAGFKSSLLDEAAASYTFAEEIKTALASYGLKAEVTRTSNEANSYYGEGSRVGLGYQKEAKVFLALALSEDDDDNRPYLVSSPYTNGTLANTIAHTLKEKGVELADVLRNPQVNNPGTAMDNWIWRDDGYGVFTTAAQLRESGGKATHTGEGDSWTANKDFQNYNGMYGLIFYYASSTNKDSQKYFLTNEGAMAEGIAQGIAEYFGIPLETQEEPAE